MPQAASFGFAAAGAAEPAAERGRSGQPAAAGQTRHRLVTLIPEKKRTKIVLGLSPYLD